MTDSIRRQLGFELYSIFKGATSESIDDAVERVISVCRWWGLRENGDEDLGIRCQGKSDFSREELRAFKDAYRDSDGTATAADCEDNPEKCDE